MAGVIVVFAFHDAYEIGPRMLSRLAKYTVLEPSGLGEWSCSA
jgi:hypothetical protein